MKIAIAQISTDPGNIAGNSKKIINYIKKAREAKADMIIFPELTIPGYMSLDLMLHQKFVEENLKALQKISEHTKNIMAVVGFIDQDKNKIGPDGTPVRYNSAAVLNNRKILAVCDKTLLPDYDVFFENRYFSQGRGRKVVNLRDLKIGVEICEDLWDENYPVKVSQDLIKKGAKLLINISCSPFYLGKRYDREKIVKKVTKGSHIPFIYVNTAGAQDGYDGELIFDGQSMVFDKNSNLVYLGKQFEEELFFIESDNLEGESKFKFPDYHPDQELFEGLLLAIRDYFRRTGFKLAFVGLSGGIDSAVVAALAKFALDKKNVTGIYMPSPFSSKKSLADSRNLAKDLGIKFKIISLEKIYGTFLDTLKKEFDNLPFDETEENIQARVRGMILMAHANKFKGLVISTANKTETALGYTTLYGDMCGAIAPLADVSKLRVYSLSRYINSLGKTLIPESIINKVPTAELRENQTDEGSLGAPYSIISPLVDEIVEEMKTSEQLYKKYPKKIVDHILRLINQNEYKRRQASPAVKITKKAFGLGRRIPIAHKFAN